MYIINKATNRIEKIETATFKQLGFKEREHLQEWGGNITEYAVWHRILWMIIDFSFPLMVLFAHSPTII